MSDKELTAEQARENVKASDYNVDKLLKQIYSSIDALSKSGSSSVTMPFSKQIVTSHMLDQAAETLKNKGFIVEVILNELTYHMKVSW